MMAKPLVDFIADILTPMASKCPCAAQANGSRAEALKVLTAATAARPKAEYTPDLGAVHWWRHEHPHAGFVPTPFVGTFDELADATTSVMFDRFTHFTELLVPSQP